MLRGGKITEISLDHDLSLWTDDGHESTGYDVVLWIEEQVLFYGFDPPVMRVHSGNPPAHERIQRAIDAIERHVARRGRPQ